MPVYLSDHNLSSVDNGYSFFGWVLIACHVYKRKGRVKWQMFSCHLSAERERMRSGGEAGELSGISLCILIRKRLAIIFFFRLTWPNGFLLPLSLSPHLPLSLLIYAFTHASMAWFLMVWSSASASASSIYYKSSVHPPFLSQSVTPLNHEQSSPHLCSPPPLGQVIRFVGWVESGSDRIGSIYKPY